MKRPIQPGIRSHAQDASASTELGNALREAAARWPAGVAVVAVRDGALFEAITITSFLVASLDPPLVLVSIDRQAAIVPLLDAVGRFGVSFLAADQQRTAALVADRAPGLSASFTDAPEALLEAALQGLACRTEAVHPAGDHRLYVARVAGVQAGREQPPLLYHERRYRRLAER